MGQWVTGHAATHGTYKIATKPHSLTARQDQGRTGQGNAAVKHTSVTIKYTLW